MQLRLDPMEFGIRDRGDGYIEVTYRGYILPDLGPRLTKRAFYISRRLVIRLYADYLQARFDRMSAHRQIEFLRLLNSRPTASEFMAKASNGSGDLP